MCSPMGKFFDFIFVTVYGWIHSIRNFRKTGIFSDTEIFTKLLQLIYKYLRAIYLSEINLFKKLFSQ